MTKTKAPTKKSASKKTAAAKTTKKTSSAKAKKPASEKAPKAKPAAKPQKPASEAKATKPVEVVAAKARAEKATPAASKPAPARAASSKPVADFGAGLASTPVVAKAAAPQPVASKPAAKPEPRVAAKPAAPAVVAKAPVAVAAPVDDTSTDTGEVAVFLRACDHPRVAEFAAVRKLILEASSAVEEGIKWNAPSFRTSEWFATFHLRDPQKVQVVFHLGAKKRETSQRIPVGAPEGMVEWLAPDRCMVTVDDVKRRGKALQAFVRGWVLHL